MEGHQEKKTLVYNFLEFLGDEVATADLPEERRESIEVAMQCLENGYEISSDDRKTLRKINLMESIAISEQAQSMEGQVQPREPQPATSQQEPELETEMQVSEPHNDAMILAEHFKALGNASMQNGEYEKAVTQYTQAIELNPNNAVFYCNRAAAYSRLENNEKAIHSCKQALKLDPSYGKAYGRLGIAYSNLGKWEDAVKAYQRSVHFEPHNPTYRRNLMMAKKNLLESMDSAAPPEHTPIDIMQFINNESFLQMARDMLSNPDFQNIMSGIMAMSQSGDTNFEALFQAGQNLAARMQTRDPEFVEYLRRHLNLDTPNQEDAPGPNQPEDDSTSEDL